MKSCKLLSLLNSTLSVRRPALRRRTGRRTGRTERRTDGRTDGQTDADVFSLFLSICRQLFSRHSRSLAPSQWAGGRRTTTSSRAQNSPSLAKKSSQNNCPNLRHSFRLPGEKLWKLAAPVLEGTSLQHEIGKDLALIFHLLYYFLNIDQTYVQKGW